MSPHAVTDDSTTTDAQGDGANGRLKMMDAQTDGSFSLADKTMPIAVVGMGCRCPGDATNPENLWKMVSEGREAWSPTPSSKYNSEAFYHPDSARNGSSNIQGGHYLKQDQALFDAPFFNLTSNEAAVMDPQQRLLLETCYEAIENAGIPMPKLVGSDTSCFVGSFCRDFTDVQLRDTETLPVYQATGGGPSLAFLSNRISYFFDLKGPSVTVDTACSASLVALHLACQAIRTGESKAAIVGGSNVILSHEIMITMNMMRFLSPDGRSYSFDHRANGYARGEGAACVVLKSLEQAIKDGDTVRAIIRNTGVNQDGKTAGITLPSKDAQQALIETVYNAAGLDPLETSYIEAHGTGTPAGDPLEASALATVFSPGRAADNPLRIGSIKSNMGHLEGCSGLAGLIKTVLMLENDLILPNRNFEIGNPHIPFQDWKLKVPTSVEKWTTSGAKRASINSFGYGGTNAHAIIESAQCYSQARNLPVRYRYSPSLLSGSVGAALVHHNGEMQIPQTAPFGQHLFTLSAFDEKSGKQQAENIAKYLEDRPDGIVDAQIWRDLAFTLNQRRTRFAWRFAVPANSIDDLISHLRGDGVCFSKCPRAPNLAYVFTGQGAQWNAMGRELIAFPAYRQSMEKSSKHLKLIGARWDLLDELSKDVMTSRVTEAALSQPLCTAVQIALVDLLATFNIRPIAVTGHSSGEIAAAYTVGALSHEDALAAAFYRGVVSSDISSARGLTGLMMAVGLSKAEALPLITSLESGRAVVACENSPNSVTISGDESAIEELYQILEAKKVFARKLAVDVAYHSHHMEVVADEYLSLLRELKVLPTNGIQFFSSVTGDQVGVGHLSASYWVKNMVSEVKFSTALQKLCLEASSGKKRRKKGAKPEVDMLIEIGPHSALAGPIKQILQVEPATNGSVHYATALTRNASAMDTFLKLTGLLYMRGTDIDLSSVHNLEGEKAQVLVDLPPYAWNHSTPLWAESRLSRAYRNRKHPRTDLLGVLDKNSNDLEPRWRNVIRPAEIPWLRDHKVQSSIVYPAAGFVTMAIEAAHQRAAEKSIEVSGFVLREVVIGTALLIPEYQPEAETLITMRPYNEGTKGTSDIWDEFCIFSVTEDNTWTQHCRGLISIQKPSPYTEVDGGRQSQADIDSYAELFKTSKARDYVTKDVGELYEHLASIGLEYGPTFSNLTAIKSLPNEAVGTIRLSNTAACMPEQFEYPFILHPSTLDSCLHPLFAAVSAADGPMKAPMVPTHIEQIDISMDISRTPGDEFQVHATVQAEDNRRQRVNLMAFEDLTGASHPVIQVRGLTCTKLSNEQDLQAVHEASKLCYRTEWRPDVDFMSTQQVRELCADIVAPPLEVARIEAADRAGYYLMERALKKIRPEDVNAFTDCHKKLFTCMQNFTKAVREGALPLSTALWPKASETEQDQHIKEVSIQNEEGSLLCHVGQHLPEIMNQQVEALSVMMEGNRLDDYYAQNIRMRQNYKFAARYVDLLAHKNPSMNILEIGAGTGGCTFPILQSLGGTEGTLARFSSYDFTDISSGFFENSSKKTAPWGSLVKYRKLNIENDPIAQGFARESFDLIIAANVLHATSSIEKVMRNVRKLLKPSGKLCLVELTRERLLTSTVFGTLPGWWAGEEPWRQKGPLMTEDQWHTILQQTGFSGVDAAVWDIPDEVAHQGSLMISSAKSDKQPYYDDVEIIIDDGTPSDLIRKLQSSLASIGVKSVVSTLSETRPHGRVSIVLVELTRSLFQRPSSQDFEDIKKVVLDSKAVLWTVRGASITSSSPTSNMITGFARTCRSESGGTSFIVLDLDPEVDTTHEESAKTVFDVFQSRFNSSASEATQDVELAQRGAYVRIPRLVEDTEMNKFVTTATQDSPVPTAQPFVQSGRPLTLEIESPGLLDTLRFVDDERLGCPLGANEVEIEIKVSGLNFHDIMMAMGQIKLDRIGCECSGIISAVGDAVADLKPGDKVVTYGHGTFSNYLRSEARAVQLVPSQMPLEVAATLPIIYCTAYHSIFVAARLQAGETCLIHAASGGLGQALIMLCQMIGVEVFLTCGTLEKKAFLMETYNIPESHIFSSRDGTFAQGIMRATKNQGVDVIMNSVAGDALRQTWECIAPFGRFIELGKRDFVNNTRLEMGRFAKNVSFCAVDFIHLCDQRPAQTSKIWAAVMDLIRRGSVKPPQPITSYGMGEIEKAFRTMQAGKHIGKIVLMSRDNEMVQALPQNNSARLLRKDASYLLVGGLGGIGRALATWMIRHGAQNIIFASRSGLTKPDALETVEYLKAQCSQIKVYKCDVSDAEQVKTMLSQSQNEMPPIRGVVQAAMVLKDALLQNMTLEDYNATTLPKVDGTWNLHNFLPKELDFFIMLSSTSGIIGNASQAQYAAASTFLDAFANYRNSLGLPAVSLDLGVILGIGYVAENEKLMKALEKQEFQGTTEQELMAMVEHAITNPFRKHDGGGQTTTGLGTWRPNGAVPAYSHPLFAHFRRMFSQESADRDDHAGEQGINARDALKSATSIEDAAQKVCECIVAKMSALLMVPKDEISALKSMSDYGIDSLVAVEMRNWLFREMDSTVSILELMANKPLSKLSTDIVSKSKLVSASLFVAEE